MNTETYNSDARCYVSVAP